MAVPPRLIVSQSDVVSLPNMMNVFAAITMSNRSRMQQNIDAMKITLTSEERAYLDIDNSI